MINKLQFTLITSLMMLSSQYALSMINENTDTPNTKSVGMLCDDLNIDLSKTDYANATELDRAVRSRIKPDMTIEHNKDYQALMKRIRTDLYPTVKNAIAENRFMRIIKDIVSDKYPQIRKFTDEGNMEEVARLQGLNDKENLDLAKNNKVNTDVAEPFSESPTKAKSQTIISYPTTPKKLKFPDDAPPKGTPYTKSIKDFVKDVDFTKTKYKNTNNFVCALSAKVTTKVDLNILMQNIIDETFDSVKDVMTKTQLNRVVRSIIPDKYRDMKNNPEKAKSINENTENDPKIASKTDKKPDIDANQQTLTWAGGIIGTVIVLYLVNNYFRSSGKSSIQVI